MSLPCIDQHIKSPYTVVSVILPNILLRFLLFAKLGLLVCALEMFLVLLLNCLKSIMKQANNSVSF